MAIIKEFYRTREDGVNLYKTVSDQNVLIRKIGTDEIYASAVDVEGAPWEYEETNTPIPVKESSTYVRKVNTETTS